MAAVLDYGNTIAISLLKGNTIRDPGIDGAEVMESI